MLFVSDLINCYFSAIDSIGVCSGEAYNIGGGMSNSISILELFSILESKLDINLSYYVTPWRSNDQKVFVADTGKAYSDFLWKPIIDKVTGIKEMIKWVDSSN